MDKATKKSKLCYSQFKERNETSKDQKIKKKENMKNGKKVLTFTFLESSKILSYVSPIVIEKCESLKEKT